MTRKDYIKLAAAIRAKVAGMPDSQKAAFSVVVLVFCDVLKADNPSFNRDRFLQACGLE